MAKIAEKLRLSQAAIGGITEHAESAYPSECCGIVAVLRCKGREVEKVYRLRNILDSPNRISAQDYAGSSRKRYFAEPGQLLRVLREIEAHGGQLRIIYHSHVDADARFSEDDRTAALLDGRPAYPGVVYLVVSVRNRRADELRAFQWNGAEFAEVRFGD